MDVLVTWHRERSTWPGDFHDTAADNIEAQADRIVELEAALEDQRERRAMSTGTLTLEVAKQADRIAELEAALLRTGEAWENLSTLPSAPSNVQGSARIFADEIRALFPGQAIS